MKVSGQKVLPPKAPNSSKNMGATSLKSTLAKTAHEKSVPSTSVVPGVRVPPKASASLGTVISKPVAMVTAPKAMVLRINMREKGRVQLCHKHQKESKRELMCYRLRTPP
jgi:hypothetical protein